MKKIVALMMLCLMLCAMSATAMAWKVTFQNLYLSVNEKKEYTTDQNGEITLPAFGSEGCGFTAQSGKDFFAWTSDGKHYLAGSAIKVDRDMVIKSSYVTSGETPVVISYSPGTGKGNAFITPVYDAYICLFEPDNYGFEQPSVSEPFKAWLVEGDFEPSDMPPDVGWLFARALADDERMEMAAYSWIQVKGPVTVTALWGDEDGEQEPPAPKYKVNVIDSQNGSVSAKDKATAGETVNLTVTPANGYGLKELKVTHKDDPTKTVTVTNNSFKMPACDVDVQATFEKRNVVYFAANGGECTVASAAVNADNKLDQLPKATRNGYHFIGWFDKSADGNIITTDTVFTAPETTVYAQWIEVKHTTKPDENDFKADLDMADPDIFDRLIAEGDLKDKKNIEVYLKVKELKEENNVVPAEDKAAIVNKAGADQIAAYLDIKLFKKIGDEELRIANTNGDVQIKLTLEDALIPENAVEDSFYIIYYHGGQAKKIPASFNVRTKELTFKAREFSTYSLVYTTQKAENADVSVLPQTGDNSMRIDFLFIVMLAALSGLHLTAKKRIN